MTLIVATTCLGGIAISGDSIAKYRQGVTFVPAPPARKLFHIGAAVIGASFGGYNRDPNDFFERVDAACGPGAGPREVTVELAAQTRLYDVPLSFIVVGFNRHGFPEVWRQRPNAPPEEPIEDIGFACVGWHNEAGVLDASRVPTLDAAAIHSRSVITSEIARAKSAGEEPMVAEPIVTYVCWPDRTQLWT
ncbi:MAG: hypothetical protein ABI629_08795 [bacterium]